jgi:hypothetical protein
MGVSLLVAAVLTATVTGFAPSAGGINCWSDCAVMHNGLPPGPRYAACGDGYPLGTLLVVGSRVVECADRGALGLWGVDLWYATEREALLFGRQRMQVVVLEGR